MWRGLGQKLKDLAEDLTNPPFEIEEDEESDAVDLPHRPVRNDWGRTQTQPQHRGHGSRSDDDDEQAYIEAEGGILIPNRSLAKGGATPAERRPDGSAGARAVVSSPPRVTAGAATAGRSTLHVDDATHSEGCREGKRSATLPTEKGQSGGARVHSEGDGPGRRAVPPLAVTQSCTVVAGASSGEPSEPPSATGQPRPVMSRDLTGTNTPDSTARLEKERELLAQVGRLEAQVRSLTEAKACMEADMQQYQERVREAHEETVAHYERQLAAMRDALRHKDEELAALHTQQLSQTSESLQQHQPQQQSAAVVEAVAADELRELIQERDRLTDTVAQLRAEAADREACFAREREVLTKRLDEAKVEAASAADAAVTAAPAAPVVAAMEAELAELRQALEKARNSTVAAASPAVDGQGFGEAEGPHAGEAPQPQNDLLRLVATKEVEIVRLTAELEALLATRVRAEEDLSQLSEGGFIKLDELLEPERSTHTSTTAEQRAAADQMAETVSRYEVRLAELEQELARRDDSRRLSSAPTPGRDAATSTTVEDGRGGPTDNTAAAASSSHDKGPSVESGRVAARELEGRLRAAEARLVEQQAAASAALGEVQTQLKSVEVERDALRGTVEELRAALDEARTSLRELEESGRADRSRLASGDASVTALTRRLRELEEEQEHTVTVMQEIQHAVVDCLSRNNSASLGDGGGDLDLFDPGECARYGFSDWIMALTAGLDTAAGLVRRSARVQAEWERTYEEARRVNDALQQQVTDAWATIGQLREESSTMAVTVRELQARVAEGDSRFAAAQERLVAVSNELQAVREEQAESRAASGGGDVADTGGGVGALELAAEVEALRVALQERDDELATAQRGMENLQGVLDSFKASRSRDIAERTVDMELEINQLREQLADAARAREDYDRGLAAAREEFEKDLARRNVEVSALHRKLAELRRALEDAAKQLNGENSIDKGVISQVLVNYIHAFVANRREAGEVLKVLASLLHWGEEMQERVGLLPGPLNPQPPQSGSREGGRRGGLLSWVRSGSISGSVSGGGARRLSGSVDSRSGGASATGDGAGSLAKLWVDFLMHESEVRTAAEGAAVAPAPDALDTSARDLSHGAGSASLSGSPAPGESAAPSFVSSP